MDEKLLTLPIGVQSFERLRRERYLYVDKTERLLELVGTSGRCFLSRPRRFGKSLTLSTLDAMFSGKVELFKGLAAEKWVAEQAEHPAPVLRLDMAHYLTGDRKIFDNSLYINLKVFGEKRGFSMPRGDVEGAAGALKDVIEGLYNDKGSVVVLIDEYDKPILDSIGDLNTANEMRASLRSFYTVLKSCDEYLRFVMLTGSKAGVFSAMNNLEDISMDRQYGDIVGYTQDELEENFAGWVDDAAARMKLTQDELLGRMKDYYDGFCFDGRVSLYNPFSIMQCLKKAEFSNYWYESGSPSFIVDYMKQHKIKNPEQYRGVVVKANFTSSQEIERADPVSFLYQAGYLTIKKKEEQQLTLDYPNREVRDSIASMYLEHVYHVESYGALGSQIWKALKVRDIEKVVELYNIALSGIPYEDYSDQGESWYRSLFLMLLRGAGVTANGEVHTNRGRPDVVAQFPGQAIVLEFKYAKDSSELESKRFEGEQQIREKNYAKPYEAGNREITTAVIVIDGGKREAVL